MRAGFVRDGAVGEVREALLDEAGRPLALRVLRWTETGARARWGEVYVGRLIAADRRLRGAFVDLGLREQQGFLPLPARGPALPDGAMIEVEVSREAVRGKSPVLRLRRETADGPPRRIAQHDTDLALAAAGPADAEARSALDAWFEQALARSVALPGGGALIVEPTSALVAIDVDAQGRPGSADPERFALDLNLAAAAEALRQLRLRNLGGLVAIDFVSMRARDSQTRLEEAVKIAAKADPWGLQVARLSRFGVLELARGQQFAPLAETLCDASGAMSVETIALAVLRAIETAARTAKGRVVEAHVGPDVAAWLDASKIEWRAALEARIGQRWRVVSVAHSSRERFEMVLA